MAMQKVAGLMAEWHNITPEMVEIEMIETDDKYQARNKRLAPFKDRGRLESASAQHIDTLALKLGKKRQLDAVWLARIDDKLYLVDGHHRLQAYRKKKRDSIPARIRDSTEMDAIMVSKACNCVGVKLPMHAEQCREAAWQHLALVTHRGRREMPVGESSHKIAMLYGISKNTLTAMKKKMTKIKLDEYPPEACDVGTGWPQWKQVRGNTQRDDGDDIPVDKRERIKTERLAERLGVLLETNGLDRFVKALRLLTMDELNEIAEQMEEAELTRRDISRLNPWVDDDDGNY